MDEKNLQQELIIQSNDKRIVVLACPGSGKTSTLIKKIVRHIHEGVSLKRVLCVTFTRKAAHEMLERLSKEVPVSKSERRNVCTLHSLGCRILFAYKDLAGLKEDYSVAVKSDKTAIIHELFPEFGDAEEIANAFLEYVSSLKNGFEKNDKFNFTKLQFDAFNARMIEKNLIDIDDYIYLPVRIITNNPFVKEKICKQFDYVYVDEYQDINKIQNDFLDLLISSNTNVLYVGDDDQSIYEFRGSNPNYILEKSAGNSGFTVFYLTKNYRSQETIVNLSKKVLTYLSTTNRRTKQIEASKKTSAIKPIRHRPFSQKSEEIAYVANEIYRLVTESFVEPKEIAVLCRYSSKKNSGGVMPHPELSEIGSALRLKGIPASMVIPTEGDSVASKHIKDLCQLLATFSKKTFDPNLCNAIRQNSYNPKRFSQLIDLVNRQYNTKLNINSGFVDLMGKIGSISIELEDKHFQFRLETLMKAYRFAKSQFDAVQKGTLPSGIIANLLAYFAEDSQLDESVRAVYEYAFLFTKSAEEGYESDTKGENEYLAIVKSLEQFLFDQDEAMSKNSVRLLTAHQSKGLQFDAVFVVGLEAGGFPSNYNPLDPLNLDNERRLFYVCVTRARELLYLTSTGYAVDDNKDLADKSFIYNVPSIYFDDKVDSFESIVFTSERTAETNASMQAKDALITQLEEERYLSLIRLQEQQSIINALEEKASKLTVEGEDTSILRKRLEMARKNLQIFNEELTSKDQYIEALRRAMETLDAENKKLKAAVKTLPTSTQWESIQSTCQRLSAALASSKAENEKQRKKIQEMTRKEELDEAARKAEERIAIEAEAIRSVSESIEALLNQIVSIDVVPDHIKAAIKKSYRVLVVQKRFPLFLEYFTSGLDHFNKLIKRTQDYLNGTTDRMLFENQLFANSYKLDLSVGVRKILEVLSSSKTILTNQQEFAPYAFLKEYMACGSPNSKYGRLVANFRRKSPVGLSNDLVKNMKTMYVLSSVSSHDKTIQKPEFTDYRAIVSSFFQSLSFSSSIPVFASFFLFISFYIEDESVMSYAK